MGVAVRLHYPCFAQKKVVGNCSIVPCESMSAWLAQSVELLFHDQRVVGSIPTPGRLTLFTKHYTIAVTKSDLKTSGGPLWAPHHWTTQFADMIWLTCESCDTKNGGDVKRSVNIGV